MCQLDAIRECKKIKLLKRALKTLPKTLDETYARVLSNIPEDYVEDVRRVLQCLICAFHPLDLREVADIVAIDPAEPYYHPEDRYSAPRELLSVCSGLVCIRTSKRGGGRYGGEQFDIEELRFAHFSVKEYLVSDRVNLSSASKYKLDEVSSHETLANLCISYLLQFEGHKYDRQSAMTTSDPEAQASWEEQSEKEAEGHFEDLTLWETNPFAPYAAMLWSMHLRAAQLDEMTPLYSKSIKLIVNPALPDQIVNYRNWFMDSMYGTLKGLGTYGNRKRIDPVYYASLLVLDHHVSQLLEGGESADSMGPSGTALKVAASKGHKPIVQLLLKMGADVNAQEVRFEEYGTYASKTALHAAIEEGHEDTALVLLDHGAAVNTWLKKNSIVNLTRANTPLEVAVLRRNTPLVKILLDRGADMGDALRIVCIHVGDVSLARLLLEKGADPWSPQNQGLLDQAIMKKNEPLQQLLVEYGANVAGVDYGFVRFAIEDPDMDEKDIEDYIVRTKAMLAQVEKRPKPSIAMPDRVG